MAKRRRKNSNNEKRTLDARFQEAKRPGYSMRSNEQSVINCYQYGAGTSDQGPWLRNDRSSYRATEDEEIKRTLPAPEDVMSVGCSGSKSETLEQKRLQSEWRPGCVQAKIRAELGLLTRAMPR